MYVQLGYISLRSNKMLFRLIISNNQLVDLIAIHLPAGRLYAVVGDLHLSQVRC